MARRNKLRKPGYQTLENRRLLAGDTSFFFDSGSGTLFVSAAETNIDGADYANEITFSVDSDTSELVVNEANRAQQRFSTSGLTQINYRGTFQNDLVVNNTDIASRVVGFAGDDNITTGGGDDVVIGGNGNDIIRTGDGDDYAAGNRGDDQLLEGFNDTGRDRFFGGDGVDTIETGAGDDFVAAHEGNDIIRGLGGNDLVCGGPGGDTIHGGFGNDNLYGNAGPDTLLGNAGAAGTGDGRCAVEGEICACANQPIGNVIVV